MANYCFFVPVLPGGADRMRKWVKAEIPSPGHDEVFTAAGITREQVWMQSTSMGDFAVVSFEVGDVGKAMEAIARSTHPWAARFRKFILEAHGADFANPPPPNVLAADWSAKPVLKAR